MSPYSIRAAKMRDAKMIATFNRTMAHETEGLEIDQATALDGVLAVLRDPTLGFYLVAEAEQKVIASLLITREWSDFRNAMFWWVQSVFVSADHRRQGVYRALYEQVLAQARREQSPRVCAIRLYVEQDNNVAASTYKALGMERSHYLLYESNL